MIHNFVYGFCSVYKGVNALKVCIIGKKTLFIACSYQWCFAAVQHLGVMLLLSTLPAMAVAT